MSKNKKKVETTSTDFKINAIVDDSVQLYTDTIDLEHKTHYKEGGMRDTLLLRDPQTIINEMLNAEMPLSRQRIIKASRLLYAINPLYNKLVEYYATMFYPRYYVTPTLIPGMKPLTGEAWHNLYNNILELTDGLNLNVKVPAMLHQILIEGGTYFTTYYSENVQSLDTLLLPSDYCQRVGETEVGTDVIQFNFQYFDNLSVSDSNRAEIFGAFPKEFEELYDAYKIDGVKWRILNPKFSSCVLMNPRSIPTLFAAAVGINNYNKYVENEVDRNTQALQTIVEHHIPTYQDKLLLEMTEMNLLHKKLSNIVKSTKNARLVTTIGEIRVHPLLENSSTVADKTLENAYKSVFDEAGINNGLFYGDNQYSVQSSLSIDRGKIWQFIEKIANFYNLAVNNLDIDLEGYQVEITMMPISRDELDKDIARYREGAKVGVGVLPFIIASGIKQKDITSFLAMESNLELTSKLTPLRSSNTMSSSYGDEPQPTTDEEPNEDK